MRNYKYLLRVDFKALGIILSLMVISLLVISSTTNEIGADVFFTSYVKNQIKWFILGFGVFFFFSLLDYHKLREWTWVLYIIAVALLLGLFFTEPIQNVRRWYRVSFIPFSLQPSELAKLIVVIALSWFLEYKRSDPNRFKVAALALCIVFIPFVLILKQPDLGSALVLFPITLVMFYFGDVNQKFVRVMTIGGLIGLSFVVSIFLGIISHEDTKPVVTKFIKEYQYERLNPENYHQNASQTAIALGRFTGSGWHKSEFTGRHFLPFGYTDSVFPAFTEEFGSLGAIILLSLFFGLIYFSFKVTAVAKDYFGRMLSSGITVYLAVHVIVNIGMMSGLLPITGVPLILITSGGSSVLSTMMALGILQSIYIRRFTF